MVPFVSATHATDPGFRTRALIERNDGGASTFKKRGMFCSTVWLIFVGFAVNVTVTTWSFAPISSGKPLTLTQLQPGMAPTIVTGFPTIHRAINLTGTVVPASTSNSAIVGEMKTAWPFAQANAGWTPPNLHTAATHVIAMTRTETPMACTPVCRNTGFKRDEYARRTTVTTLVK